MCELDDLNVKKNMKQSGIDQKETIFGKLLTP